MESVRPRVSFADLQRMPDDGKRYELYDGVLRVVPSPLPIHEIVKHRILEQLFRYSTDRGGRVFDAPFDIALSDYDVVQPDIIYFAPSSASRIRPREHVRFRPDLAIEVLSPSTACIDRGRKRELLARHGLPEYWLVDYDARTLEAWLLTSEAERGTTIRSGAYESPTLPGLAVDVDRLFAGLE